MSVKNRKADILLASQGHLSPSADPFRYWAHCTLSCKCFLHDLLPCFSDTVRPCPWHFLPVPHRTFLPHTACGAKRPLSRLLILGQAMLLWDLLGPATNSDMRSSFACSRAMSSDLDHVFVAALQCCHRGLGGETLRRSRALRQGGGALARAGDMKSACVGALSH